MASVMRAGFAAVALALMCSAPARADSSFNPFSWFGNSQQQPTKQSEKLVTLPARPEDLDCPPVDIFEGGATSRVGGPTNDAVRYQFNIADVARECDPQGRMFALKVGVSGNLLLGPAGSPGSYSTTLRVQVKRDIDDKVLYDKVYRVSADTAGSDRAPYRLVSDPIVLPLTRAGLDQDYSIRVGLGASAAPVARRHGRHRR